MQLGLLAFVVLAWVTAIGSLLVVLVMRPSSRRRSPPPTLERPGGRPTAP